MENQKLQKELESKENAERVMQNLRELAHKSSQLISKRVGGSKITSKTSKIKQLIDRKQTFILEK